MRISELTLENFCGIERLTLALHETGAVFYGVNGAGKSTVIKAQI